MKKSISFLAMVLIFFAPVLVLILQSFSETWRFQTGNGITFQLDSYFILFSDPNVWEATGWSIAVGTLVLILNILIGLSTGKALAFGTVPGKSVVESFLLAPILIPVLAIAMGLHLFMIRIGLADTLAGVIVIHLVPTVPYTIRIFHHAYKQLGISLLEQAATLGAGPWQQLITIELPLIKAAIRSVTFLTIVISLSQYAITAIIGGGRIITLPMVFFPYLDSANSSIMAAFSVWFALIPFFIYLIAEGTMLLLPYSKPRRRTPS